MAERPDPTHLQWAIDQRAKIQHTLLALYVHVRARTVDDAWSAEELVLDALIAAAFSLWRAVFLADRPQTDMSRRQAQEEFLATVISTNAITFADDRRHSAWSVGYYMATASSRIWSAAGLLDNMIGSGITKDITRLMVHYQDRSVCNTRYEWEGMHAALRGLFNLLEPLSTLSIERPDDPDIPI